MFNLLQNKIVLPLLTAVALHTTASTAGGATTDTPFGEGSTVSIPVSPVADGGVVCREILDTVIFPISASIPMPESKKRLERLAVMIDSLNRNDTIASIRIEGFSSPDGPLQANVDLARRRAQAAFSLLDRNTEPGKNYVVLSRGEDWEMLRELVTRDASIPGRTELLNIIDSGLTLDEKERRMRSLGKNVWNYLVHNAFPAIRRADITVRWHSSPEMRDTVNLTVDTIAVESAEIADAAMAVPQDTLAKPSVAVTTSVDHWNRHYHIKTNLLGWPCLWANLAGEADIASHWSADLSIYYSGWNWFRSTTKFRTFTIMPEVRYWPKASDSNDGFFLGAHFGLCYFNVAFPGHSRYQDHDGNTPALGGGLSIGYRLPLRNPRWKFEFSAGAGAYRLDYDIFENRPNGSLTGRRKRTFFGLDKVAVSLCYTFGPVPDRRKGGGR